MTPTDLNRSPLWRLATVLNLFRDMRETDSTIAAFATDDGGTARITYGDLFTLMHELTTANERLDRIHGWHSRETGPAGTVGDHCNECGHMWPCDTRRMAEGTYTDDTDT